MHQQAAGDEPEIESPKIIPYPETGQIEPQQPDGVDPFESEDRRWIRVITRILETRRSEHDTNPTVQLALDRLYLTAANRAARILRADMTAE